MQASTKSANRLYQEYKKDGGTLSFKDWMTREKAKGFINATGGEGTVPVNAQLNGEIASAVAAMNAEGGAQSSLSSQYTFGISNTVLIGVGVGLVLVVGFLIYQKKFAKK